MAQSGNLRLAFDVGFLSVYVLWIVFSIKFIMDTPFLDIPKKQNEIAFYSVWFLVCVYHAGVMYRDNRIAVLHDFFHHWRRKLRDCVRKSCQGLATNSFIGVLHYSKNLNAVLEGFIIGCTCVFAALAGVQTMFLKDQAFYLQNFMFSILYHVSLRLTGVRGTQTLVVNLAYICLHGGCVADHLGYDGGHFAFVFGAVVFVLYFAWKFLDFDSSSESRRFGGNSPDDNAPGDGGRPGPSRGNPSDDRPSGDNPSGDVGNSPKDPQWKPKQKRKKRR